MFRLQMTYCSSPNCPRCAAERGAVSDHTPRLISSRQLGTPSATTARWWTVGKAEMGQHISSTMAQFVAEELEASWKDMHIVLASNDPKYNDPSSASNSPAGAIAPR